jgi:NAD(P)-dependent dehydrogenase (short-subunit alcohol dehydrogenase family)
MSEAVYKRCVVFGAAGGIGGALVRALAARPDVEVVWAGGRDAAKLPSGAKIHPFTFDLTDEASIAAAVQGFGGGVDLCLVATGRLTRANGTGPEKSWRALEAEGLAEMFAINAIGPALVAKHVLPLLPRQGPAVFGALSARVGSIADNRLGGWHGYRAAKAALNMLLRNFAIELGRRNPEGFVVGLHPGTVDTALSGAFHAGVSPDKLFTPDVAAGHLLRVIAGLAPGDNGQVFGWDGERIEF